MKIINVIENCVNWLFEPTKVPFMVEDGVGTTSNLGVIFMATVVVCCILVCCVPKLRKQFF